MDADGRPGCWWAGSDPDYRRYHDDEWGRPVTDDVRLFEKLCLEGFQAGLSWLTILRKRENFRRAFADFDPEAVAAFGPTTRPASWPTPGSSATGPRSPPPSTTRPACWSCRRPRAAWPPTSGASSRRAADRPARLDHAALAGLGSSPASTALSKDLKRRGWRFVGPTTVYAFMQAMGLVNDHLEGCRVREEVETARRALPRPIS